jgi:hypothetical protein
MTIGPPASPVSVASSSQPEYLSGKVTVRVSGNDNPIIRVGLASSGVTLVEFPAMDRFFALHPGNSDLVTIDESPTKQNDHFFVFRAGSNFLPPPSRPSTAPSTSIIAQMRSGLVITLLVYPVRQVEDMAHTVVILYDRTDVVASRRAAGLAVNLEENQTQKEHRSIRVAVESGTSVTSPASEQQEQKNGDWDRTVESKAATSTDSTNQTPQSPDSLADPNSSVGGQPVNPSLESDARLALKTALTSSRFKNWSPPVRGLSLATSTPRELKDGTAVVVVVAVRNLLAEPVRLVPGQPDLSVETRDEKGKPLLVERLKKLHVECSGIGNSVPAASTLYYAIVYKRPILGVNQRLRVAAGHINAADSPAVAELTAAAR